jgi:hypothetical protein
MRIVLLSVALAITSQCVIELIPIVQDQLRPRRFARVEVGLYRSGEIAPRLVRDVLAEHDIRKIVWMLHYDATKTSHRAERRAAEALGIEIVNLHLRGDGTGEVSRYVEAIAEIHETRRAGGAVLVQCAAGSRRSAGVVALYQLLVERRPPDAVYAELDRFGEPVAGTPLLPYLNLHLPEIAAGLAARGVIERVPAELPVLTPPPPAASWRRRLPWLQAQLAVW